MRYSIYIDKERILKDFQVESSVASYFIEKYINSLSDYKEQINFLELLKIENTRLDNLYLNYCSNKNINIQHYLMSIPKLKYREIKNFKPPKFFNHKTLEHHGWNQLHYIAGIKKHFPMKNYSDFFCFIYEIYKQKNYSVLEIEDFFNHYEIDLYNIKTKEICLMHIVFNI